MSSNFFIAKKIKKFPIAMQLYHGKAIRWKGWEYAYGFQSSGF